MSGISRFLHSALHAALKQQNLASFDALWNMERNWVETPNQRRQGWSGVCRHELPDTGLPAIFIKRQENHNTRTVLHPFNGVPTYRRELESILRFQKHGIPTITPVYYGEKVEGGNHQAILITIALDGYQDINAMNKEGDDSRTIPALIELGRVVRKMHDKGLAHYCLYPSHSFAKVNGDAANVCLIDLEKARRDILETRRRFKDLECFMRHTESFSLEAREQLISSYFSAGNKLSSERGIRQRLDHLMTRPQR